MQEVEMPSPIPMDGDAMIDSFPCTPPIPAVSLGSVSNATPQRGHKTPHKVYYNSQQFQSPTARLASRLQQASPCLHTPTTSGAHFLRTPGSGQGLTSGSGQRATPRFRTPSSGARARDCKVQTTPKYLHTPKGIPMYNPFDNHDFDQLGGPVCSPNVFSTVGNEEEASPQPFRWSIDQLAILKPADIEENVVQDDMHMQSENPELEERAQKAIDDFFSNQYIVPSPWTDTKKPAFQLPRTPGNESMGSPMIFSGKSAEKKSQAAKKDAVCQTTLALPLDFDLEKVLGEYYTYQEPVDTTTPTEESPQDLSTSSLRRKLFFNPEVATPPSPPRAPRVVADESVDFSKSPEVSPVKCFTPNHLQKIPTPSPGSGHFSSSPISRKHMTPSVRRCSQMQPSDGMKSPELSPIAIQAEGMDIAATPLTVPFQGTPSTCQPSAFGTPGMSPIRTSGSYIETPASNSRFSSIKAKKPPKSMLSLPFEKSLDSPSTFMKEDLERQFSPIFKENNSKAKRKEYAMNMFKQESSPEMDTGVVDMRRSLDCTESFHKSPPIGDPRRPLSIPRDFEFGDHDESATQDPALQTYFHGSDTGYHTNSLQLTGQDTASQCSTSNATGLEGALHTNLTNQFGSLPFNPQDTGVEFQYDPNVTDPRTEPYFNNVQYFSKNVPKALELSGCEVPEQKRTRNPRFGQLNFNDQPPAETEPVLDQEEVIRRARRALALNTSSTDASPENGI